MAMAIRNSVTAMPRMAAKTAAISPLAPVRAVSSASATGVRQHHPLPSRFASGRRSQDDSGITESVIPSAARVHQASRTRTLRRANRPPTAPAPSTRSLVVLMRALSQRSQPVERDRQQDHADSRREQRRRQSQRDSRTFPRTYFRSNHKHPTMNPPIANPATSQSRSRMMSVSPSNSTA